MSLDEYERKRDFQRTAEPKPAKGKASGKGLRFVVQKHNASRLHYDFRLEHGGVLVSWAVPKGPSLNPKDRRLAMRVEDHPYAYKDFEGTIAKGEYGAGTVMLWDEGTWEPEGDAETMLKDGDLKFTLHGERLKGRWGLVRIKPRPGEDGDAWLLIKKRDDMAAQDAGIEQFDTSVRTGRTMGGISGKPEDEEKGKGPSAGAKKPRRASPKKPRAGSKADRGAKGTAKGGSRAGKSPADRFLPLTSPDKEMYPGVTKRDVMEYYRRIAPRMLPYIEGRLASLVRCPSGAGGKCFYQKHLEDAVPGLSETEIREADGSLDDYLAVEGEAGLLNAVQMNAIEFHAWGSKVEMLEKPDTVVFDLDPDTGLELDAVRRGLKDLKGILDGMGLASFLKTSGSKGYHVVVPLSPASDWGTVHAFARRVAETMEGKWPGRYTSDARKTERKGKVFVDWLRNARGATSVAPYSLRARDVPAVSYPIAWEDIGKVGPKDITIKNVFRRRKDPWAGYFDVRQSVE